MAKTTTKTTTKRTTPSKTAKTTEAQTTGQGPREMSTPPPSSKATAQRRPRPARRPKASRRQPRSRRRPPSKAPREGAKAAVFFFGEGAPQVGNGRCFDQQGLGCGIHGETDENPDTGTPPQRSPPSPNRPPRPMRRRARRCRHAPSIRREFFGQCGKQCAASTSTSKPQIGFNLPRPKAPAPPGARRRSRPLAKAVTHLQGSTRCQGNSCRQERRQALARQLSRGHCRRRSAAGAPVHRRTSWSIRASNIPRARPLPAWAGK